MSRLTREGTVEPVSRDQILRRLILTLAICDDYAYIYYVARTSLESDDGGDSVTELLLLCMVITISPQTGCAQKVHSVDDALRLLYATVLLVVVRAGVFCFY